MGAAEYRALSDAMERASEMAKRELCDVWGRLDPSRPEEMRDALLVAFPAIAEKWGNVAALAAAEYYEGERRAAIGGDYGAELAPPVDPGAARAKVRWAMGHVFGEG